MTEPCQLSLVIGRPRAGTCRPVTAACHRPAVYLSPLTGDLSPAHGDLSPVSVDPRPMRGDPQLVRGDPQLVRSDPRPVRCGLPDPSEARMMQFFSAMNDPTRPSDDRFPCVFFGSGSSVCTEDVDIKNEYGSMVIKIYDKFLKKLIKIKPCGCCPHLVVKTKIQEFRVESSGLAHPGDRCCLRISGGDTFSSSRGYHSPPLFCHSYNPSTAPDREVRDRHAAAVQSIAQSRLLSFPARPAKPGQSRQARQSGNQPLTLIGQRT